MTAAGARISNGCATCDAAADRTNSDTKRRGASSRAGLLLPLAMRSSDPRPSTPVRSPGQAEPVAVRQLDVEERHVRPRPASGADRRRDLGGFSDDRITGTTVLRLRPLARVRYRLTLTTGRGCNRRTMLDRIVRLD